MSQYLSKSDFKLARTCPTKLYFKKMKFPSRLDDDDYLKLLAKGGYMIETIAHNLYPDGVLVDHSSGNEAAIAETHRLLEAGHKDLFEPTFVSNGKLVRVDIFRIVRDTIELIEVKAKSWDSSVERDTTYKKKPGVKADWEPYIADVAYQKRVLEEIFPDHTIIPYLLMPDRAKTTTIDLLHKHFDIEEKTNSVTGYTNYEISFTGDAEELRRNHFLTRVNVEEEIGIIEQQIDDETLLLLDILQPDLTHVSTPLSKHCRSCEFRTDEYDSSGYAQCWGELGRQDNHIFDLYYGTTIPGADGFLFDEMIANKKAGLFDLEESQFRGVSGTIGKRNERQIIQLQHTRENTEWQDDELKIKMKACRYPMHFIDFETSSLAIPYHDGMRPYENVAFQWSCHTMSEPGGQVTHSEWINTEDAFPNFAFAQSLRTQVGDNGTVLIWSHHEQTILRDIRAQMEKQYFYDADLSAWLNDFLGGDRVADMYKWCTAHYFHPLMKGRLSIKNVCEAVWMSDANVRSEFPEYVAHNAEGELLSPYAGLPPVSIHGMEMDISVGTDAVTAYQSMLYGLDRGDTMARESIRSGLVTYCKLDTASMVMIWRHWATA